MHFSTLARFRQLTACCCVHVCCNYILLLGPERARFLKHVIQLRCGACPLPTGVIAAALFEYRSGSSIELGGRATSAPYVALNLTWHGIARLWAATPVAARRLLYERGGWVGGLVPAGVHTLLQQASNLARHRHSRASVDHQ